MKKHGCLWWVLIGWWWRPMTLPFWLPVVLIKKAKARGNKTELPELPELPKPTTQAKPAGREEHHGVAGVSFRQDAIKSLGMKNPDYAKTKKALVDEGMVDTAVYEYNFVPQRAELQPEPDNPVDPNAIKVMVGGVHIGYIKAGSCAHIHKLLKADKILQVSCTLGGGKRKYVTQDEDDGHYALEQDETTLHARLTIVTKPEK